MASEARASQLAIGGYKICFRQIVSETKYELVDGSEGRICGSRFPQADNVVPGMKMFRHRILMEPTAEELDYLLVAMGLTESPTDTFSLGEEVASFAMIIDRVAKVHTYATCYCDKAILRGQRGSKPVSLELQIISTSESEGNAGSFSANSISTRTGPYAFNGMSTLSIGGTPYQHDQFALMVDHKLAPRYNNAVTPDDVNATSCDIFLATTLPYTSTEAGLYTTGTGSSRATEIAGIITLAYGNVSTVFTLSYLKYEATPPSIESKFSEIRLPLFYRAYADGANLPLVVTHDGTP